MKKYSKKHSKKEEGGEQQIKDLEEMCGKFSSRSSYVVVSCFGQLNYNM